MTKITRPEVAGTLSQAQISPSKAAQSGAGFGAIGAEQQNLGRGIQQSNAGALSRQLANEVEQMGRQYWEQSKRTHQTAVLTNSISDATIEYEKAIMNRKQNVVDEDGNPTFMTLGEDVRKIGEDIRDSIASKILDPEVANRFRNDFTQFTTSKQISAMKSARRQQIGFAKTSLDNGLGTLLKQGINDTDPDNLTTYETQGHKLLDDALAGGLVNPGEHSLLKDQYSISLREGMLEGQIQRDTENAAGMLQSSASELGIPEESKGNLDKQLDAKVKSDIIESEKIAEQAVRDEQTSQATLAEDIKQRILADAIREDELLRQEKKLLPSSFKKLKKMMIGRAKKRRVIEKSLNEISTAIAKGENIRDENAKDIDEHFKREVERQAEFQNRDLSMLEKASVASVYKRPVKTFSKELESKLLFGKASGIEDAVSAWNLINDNNSEVIKSNFNSKAEAVARTVETLITRAGMSANEAYNVAQERIITVDQEVLKERKGNFKDLFMGNGGILSRGELKETMSDEFDIEGFFGLNEPERIPDSVAVTYRELVNRAYIEVGDENGAVDLANERFKKTHGVSEFNPKGDLMFLPPEKLYKNFLEVTGLTTQDLRGSFEEDVTPLLPEGINIEGVSIVSDNKTQFTKRYRIEYTVETENGSFKVPLRNKETNQLKEWYPDFSEEVAKQVKRIEEFKTQQVEEAKQEEDESKFVFRRSAEEFKTFFGDSPTVTKGNQSSGEDK